MWGGDPECVHEWGAGLRLHKGGPHGNGVMLKGGRSIVEAQASTKDVNAGAFCERCGAWSGVFGLEPTLQLYVEHAVEIFAAVRRVLRPDGVVWMNLGDSYATGTGKARKPTQTGKHGYWENPNISHRINGAESNLKPKDLCGIPWRTAFALQDDGWYLRAALPWIKANPMPESCTDRPGSGIEYFFLLSKSDRYHYDHIAVRTAMKQVSIDRLTQPNVLNQPGGDKDPKTGNRSHKKAINNQAERLIKHEKWKSRQEGWENYDKSVGRNFRNTDLFLTSLERPYGLISDAEGEPLAIDRPTEPYKEAHFATFGPQLIEPLILAGCPPGGTVLDPFGGAGTTGLVAQRLGRDAILVELNPEYVAMAERRLVGDAGMFAEVSRG